MGSKFKAVLVLLFAAFAMRACVLEPVRMSDESMNPVLAEGELAFVSKLSYGIRVPGAGAMLLKWKDPQKGDLVVAVAVGDPPMNILRKVANLPGETVKDPEGKDMVLKPNEYFLIAEQSEGVMDSRKLGAIPQRAIIGKVTYIWNAKRSSNEQHSKVESENHRGKPTFDL